MEVVLALSGPVHTPTRPQPCVQSGTIGGVPPTQVQPPSSLFAVLPAAWPTQFGDSPLAASIVETGLGEALATWTKA